MSSCKPNTVREMVTHLGLTFCMIIFEKFLLDDILLTL